MTCDAMGRIVTRRVEGGSGHEEHYAYNRRGQLTEARNAYSSVQRTYDIDGRLTAEAQRQAEALGTLDYAYDAAGRLQTQRRTLQHLAVGTSLQQSLTYGYDAIGQPGSLQIDGHEPIRFTHDVAGRLAQTHFTATLAHRYEYDPAGRLRRQVAAHTGQRDEVIDYRYDVSGNLVIRSDSLQGEDRYRYDPLGRIIAHTDPVGHVRHFVHDSHGDRFRSRS